MARPRSWTDQQFLAAVGEARSYEDLGARLGLGTRNGQQNQVFRNHAARLGVEPPPDGRCKRARPAPTGPDVPSS